MSKMKRLFSVVIIGCLVLLQNTYSISAKENVASNIAKEEENIITNNLELDVNDFQDIIVDFVVLYEAVESNEKLEKFIGEKLKYFDERDSLIIKMALQEQVLLLEEFPELQKINIKRDFTVVSCEDKDGVKRINVDVLEEWNYIDCLSVKSAERKHLEFMFYKQNQKWRLRSVDGLVDSMFIEELKNRNIDLLDALDLQSKLQFNTQIIKENIGVFKEAVKSSSRYEKKGAQLILNNVLAASTYNRDAAVSYALQYALSYNPNYPNFGNLGGDCTNFVSQCLRAGGITMHYGATFSTNSWYLRSGNDYSSAWTTANILKDYLYMAGGKINAVRLNSTTGLDRGDLIQLTDASGKATHSLIVSSVISSTSGNKYFVCAHTENVRNVSLTQYAARTKIYHKIWGGLN